MHNSETILQDDLFNLLKSPKGEAKKKVSNTNGAASVNVSHQTVSPETLARDFSEIRSYLAANAEGMTRDETLVKELSKILLTKAYDEKISKLDKKQALLSIEGDLKVCDSVRKLWKKTREAASLLDFDDIVLDDNSLKYVISRLQKYHITDSKRDALGEVFEALIGPSLRGGQGQFFTPKNVVQAAVRMLNPTASDRVIDPACGSGGFILEAAKYVMQNGSTKSDRKSGAIVGIDKDSFLVSLARSQLLLMDLKPTVFCQNSLALPTTWDKETFQEVKLESFDFVITNPPFGAQIPVTGDSLLLQYDLAKKWNKKSENEWQQTKEILDSRPPQILFIERCWALLKDGGICAMVLPEGILGNVNDGYVREWLRPRAEILAIVDCPLETFMPSTSTKTSILIFKKTKKPKPNKIFIAVADNCGHDRRGNPLFGKDGQVNDDFPEIAEAYIKFKREE